MNKVAIVFWSGTGHTEQMARAIAEGAGEAVLLSHGKLRCDRLWMPRHGCGTAGGERI